MLQSLDKAMGRLGPELGPDVSLSSVVLPSSSCSLLALPDSKESSLCESPRSSCASISSNKTEKGLSMAEQCEELGAEESVLRSAGSEAQLKRKASSMRRYKTYNMVVESSTTFVENGVLTTNLCSTEL